MIQEKTNGSCLFQCRNAIHSMLNQFHRFANIKQISSYENATEASLGCSTLQMIVSKGVNLAGGLSTSPPLLVPCFRSRYVAAYHKKSKRKQRNNMLAMITIKPGLVRTNHLYKHKLILHCVSFILHKHCVNEHEYCEGIKHVRLTKHQRILYYRYDEPVRP